MRIVDLRSDTITKPSAGMRKAMYEAEVGDDVFMEDPTANKLQEFAADMFGKEAALFVPSGVMGNQICLNVLTNPGDEVICDSECHIFHYESGSPAALSGIQLYPVVGKKGIFSAYDIEPLIRPASAYYMPQTRVIEIENTHNRAGGNIWPIENIKEIKNLADKYNLYILEDGAQGFGGNINGKMACSLGDISTTSFFPAKPLGCYGDGGAIFTDNDEWAGIINSLKVHGKGSFKYDNVRIGMNSRLDTLQAAILKPKFKAFRDYEVIDINKAAALYTEKLRDIVKTPVIPEGYYSSWAQYTIQLENREQRDGLQSYLKENGIPSMVYYPNPMHKQTAYKDLGYKDGDFPVTEKLCATVLSLPLHPYITEDEISKVCVLIEDYVK